jgi:hypothetical protein
MSDFQNVGLMVLGRYCGKVLGRIAYSSQNVGHRLITFMNMYVKP